MLTVNLLVLVLAFLCFVLAAIGIPSKHVSLVPLGLAFWVLTLLVR